MKTKEEILNTFNIQEGAYWAYREGLQEGYNKAISSLRNQAAIAAMQGLAANPNKAGNIKDFTKVAIEYANELVEELIKE